MLRTGEKGGLLELAPSTPGPSPPPHPHAIGGRLTASRCIAVAQTCPIPGDVAANLAQHVTLAHLAIAGGAEVVVFPELSLTGYELAEAPALAFERLDSRLEPLLALARRYRVTLVVGAPVRLGGRLHLGAAVLDADGGLEWYAKLRG